MQLTSQSMRIRNESVPGESTQEPSREADEFPVIVLGRRDSTWQASVRTEIDTWQSSSGSLEDTLLLVKERFFPRSGVILAHAAYRDAFLPHRARLKVEPYTNLDRHTLQVLIDASALPSFLDLADARISQVDLSRATIEREWNESPDASGRVPPFWKSRDTGGLNLFGVNLEDAWLSGVDLSGADLRTAKLRKIDLAAVKLLFANANGAMLEDAAIHHSNFDGATLVSARLRGAALINVSFRNAKLTWADLRGARFFHGTCFDGADLSEAHLEAVDFYPLAPGALRGAFWATTYLDRSRRSRDQLDGCVGEEIVAERNRRRAEKQAFASVGAVDLAAKPWLSHWDARESYLNLKTNFNSIGRYADASWAYRRERTMERKALGHEWRANGAWRWGSLWRWWGNWVAWILTGYGELWCRPIATGVAIIAANWGAFYWLGNVGYAPDGGGEPERLNCWDSLAYSTGAFLTVGFSDFVPLTYLARVMTVLESGLGIMLVALLLYCLGNRISRS